MGFWNKLGKIALQAAPYVAAPFTGGASLMATGVTQKLGQKWAEHDAKNAIAKGLAPSKFDKYLGLASAGAGLATSFGPIAGALSGASKAAGAASNVGKAASTAGKVSNWQSKLGTAAKIGNAAVSAGGLIGGAVQIANEKNTSRGEEPTSQGLGPSGSASMATPRQGNLRDIMSRGRNEAIVNQPFRRGYETVAQGPEEGQTVTQKIPPMYPNYGPPPSDDGAAPASIFNQAPAPATGRPIANRFADALTPPRMARRRAPAVEE